MLWLGVQFVKTKQTEPHSNANHFHPMIKFMQKFTHLEIIVTFAHDFPHTNQITAEYYLFLANNLYSEHKVTEIRKKLTDFHKLKPCSR